MLYFLLDIRSISPSQGSTLGGTRVTIQGNDFGDDKEAIEVDIWNSRCIVLSVSNDEIVCETSMPSGNYTSFNSTDSYQLYPGNITCVQILILLTFIHEF